MKLDELAKRIANHLAVEELEIKFDKIIDDSRLYPKEGLIVINEKYKDKLLVILNTLNYYELINTMDILARTDYIQQIYFNYIYVIPPIWEISDEEIVDVTINDDNSITIKALKSGAVNIKNDGIECNITINNK